MRRLLAGTILAVFALAGCHQKQQPPAEPTHNWAKLIVGDWVSSEKWPAGGREDNCATDTDFQFGPDGSYGIDSGAGRWRLQGDQLITAITTANPDGDEGPPFVRLHHPIIIHTRLINIKGSVIVADTDGKRQYWYRCK